ncbi:hypothetical protein [Streptomyces xiamenensis]|uniref:hypothetical protein n=1 Tax=Streptomyces xiamenensis TaxID=408015 RepID=UPI003D7150C7
MSLTAPHAPYIDAVVAALDAADYSPDLVAITPDPRDRRTAAASITLASGLVLRWCCHLGWRIGRHYPAMPGLADPADVAHAALLAVDHYDPPATTARWPRAHEIDQALADRDDAIARGALTDI